MSPVMKKPVFKVFSQAGLEPDCCTATCFGSLILLNLILDTLYIPGFTNDNHFRGTANDGI